MKKNAQDLLNEWTEELKTKATAEAPTTRPASTKEKSSLVEEMGHYVRDLQGGSAMTRSRFCDALFEYVSRDPRRD